MSGASAVNRAVIAERAACAAFITAKSNAATALLSAGKFDAEMTTHLTRILNQIAADIRGGLHILGE